jgi:hypothetical protein
LSPIYQPDTRVVVPSQLTSVGDGDRGVGLVITAGRVLDFLDNFRSFQDFAKDAMFAVEPVGDFGGDEELRAY